MAWSSEERSNVGLIVSPENLSAYSILKFAV